MSLMGLLEMNNDNCQHPTKINIPNESKEKFAFMNKKDQGYKKIGIVWSGSLTFANNHNRATGINSFLSLGELPGVRLFSLQKGPTQKQLYQSGAISYIQDLGSMCTDFADTAAVIDNLDAIVMTDSSVAHLAGSMGKPIYNLLNHVPYWLYQLDNEYSSWYPMRLIKQKAHNDWEGVFEVVKALLVVPGAKTV